MNQGGRKAAIAHQLLERNQLNRPIYIHLFFELKFHKTNRYDHDLLNEKKFYCHHLPISLFLQKLALFYCLSKEIAPLTD